MWKETHWHQQVSENGDIGKISDSTAENKKLSKNKQKYCFQYHSIKWNSE